ncbi:MAG: hypothetical protein WEC75_06065 [Dehalococcoidia bacterium]
MTRTGSEVWEMTAGGEDLADLAARWQAVLALYGEGSAEPVDPGLIERYLWWEGLSPGEVRLPGAVPVRRAA